MMGGNKDHGRRINERRNNNSVDEKRQAPWGNKQAIGNSGSDAGEKENNSCNRD
jgi:uncharacterized protein YjcR